MQPRNLISTARRLVGKGRLGQPRQTDLKRALSTAYYAMFHALCLNGANSLVGKSPAHRSHRAWKQAYRAVEHGIARKQCEKREIMRDFPVAIQDFARIFVDLQTERHLADYDPDYKFRRHEVLFSIAVAEVAIKQLQN